ncbi:MAG TPA: thioredoxin-dependent thiol peroxidase [Bacteroidetes bacterium]|nr:thioredoxin-dependent thiol peroxidase [Bacteroidota bacterium]
MTHLKEGDKAPEIHGTDENGKPLSLADFKGKKLILYFYPADNTPTCTVESCDLRDNFDGLKKEGYAVLGVSPDSAKKHQNFIKKHGLPFPLLVDDDKKTIKAYGVWGMKKSFGREYMGLMRTTFVISENGTIEKVFTKVQSKRHSEQIREAMN